MQFLKLAILAGAASAAAIEKRADQTIWTVSKFHAEHVAHSSMGTTAFHIMLGDILKTQCAHNQDTKYANNLPVMHDVKCENPDVTFSQYPVKNADGYDWNFSVTYCDETRIVHANTSYYHTKGNPIEFEKLDLGPEFFMYPN